MTTLLKSKGMWDNAVVIFHSDNGGRTMTGFGHANWPLRGHKNHDLQVRAQGWLGLISSEQA